MTGAEFIEIMKRVQTGDTRALGTIYQEYHAKLYFTAFDILHNREDAEDVASDVIVKLAEFKGDVGQISNHVGYLIAMARNCAINLIQKRKHEVTVAEVYETEKPGSENGMWREDLFRLLTKEEWDLFLRHTVWGFSLKDAAKEIGMHYTTAKRRYRSVKQKVRQYFDN